MQKANKAIYHILFWIFIFFYTFEVLEYEYGWLPAISFSLAELLVYASICYGNLYLLIPRLLENKGRRAYIFGLFAFLLVLITSVFAFGIGTYYEDSNLRIAFIFSLNYILYTVISFLYWYLILYQKEKRDNLALKYDKLQAELLLLKSQVSPHFLFNSLNNIYSLAVVKHDNAPVMIEKLSDILRYIIYEGTKKKVSLEREVELLNNYVDLQMLKKLKAEKNIEVHIHGVQSRHAVAPLILINIVENCFKHSNIAYDEKGFLKVNVKVEDNWLHFSTTNSYKATNTSDGIGLQNTRQQLQHNYPEAHELKIEKDAQTFSIELHINLES